MKMNAQDKVYFLCEACQKPVSTWGIVKLGSYDPERRYRSSNKKIISNYRWRLCSKHFHEVMKIITKSIEAL